MRLAKICACLFPAPLLPAILCPDSATGTAFAPLPPLLRFSVIVGGASATSPKDGAPARPPSRASETTPMNASPSSRAAFAALRASLLRSRSDLYLRLPLRPTASSSPSASFAHRRSRRRPFFFSSAVSCARFFERDVVRDARAAVALVRTKPRVRGLVVRVRLAAAAGVA